MASTWCEAAPHHDGVHACTALSLAAWPRLQAERARLRAQSSSRTAAAPAPNSVRSNRKCWTATAASTCVPRTTHQGEHGAGRVGWQYASTLGRSGGRDQRRPWLRSVHVRPGRSARPVRHAPAVVQCADVVAAAKDAGGHGLQQQQPQWQQWLSHALTAMIWRLGAVMQRPPVARRTHAGVQGPCTSGARKTHQAGG